MSREKIKLFIIAGEVSGDFLGAKIIEHFRTLLQEHDIELELQGIGDQRLTAQGLKSLFPMQDIAVMGILEIIPHLSRILNRIKVTAKAIEEFNPDIVLTIDAQGFCKKIVKKVKPHVQSRFVHIVAPQVWAWKKKRAKTLHKVYDDLLCLFPFEPELFNPHGMRSICIGHPIIEKYHTDLSPQEIREKYQIPSDHKVLSVLPGSRKQELKHHLGVLKDTLEKLTTKMKLTVFLPVVPHLKHVVIEHTKGWNCPVHLLESDQEKSEAYCASDAALVCSGTATLEVAIHKTPLLVFYQGSRISAVLAKLLIKLEYISLSNLVCFFGKWFEGKENAPFKELLTKDCTSENITEETLRLLDHQTEQYAYQQKAFEYIQQALQPEGNKLPSQKAAEYLLEITKSL